MLSQSPTEYSPLASCPSVLWIGRQLSGEVGSRMTSFYGSHAGSLSEGCVCQGAPSCVMSHSAPSFYNSGMSEILVGNLPVSICCFFRSCTAATRVRVTSRWELSIDCTKSGKVGLRQVQVAHQFLLEILH